MKRTHLLVSLSVFLLFISLGVLYFRSDYDLSHQDETPNSIKEQQVENRQHSDTIPDYLDTPSNTRDILSVNEPLITEDLFNLTIEQAELAQTLTPPEDWPDEAELVGITSTLDQEIQEAFFLASEEPAPLVISLHQWSGSYENFDPMVHRAIEQGWNYIRPNFRGPNTHPKAGGSEYVIQDIDDAISFAVLNGNVDLEQIYMVGASGGGHAALMHLMHSELPVANYSVWVPVTDLVAWYGESRVRDTRYAGDILAITESEDGQLNLEEARNRSPLYQETPVERVARTQVHILAGVNDGYSGTVPISHSLHFYNKLVSDLELGEEHLISDEIQSQLIYNQTIHEDKEFSHSLLEERSIIYRTEVDNISLTIFDGTHEILYDSAFNLLQENLE